MTLSQVPRELAERLVPHPQTCTEQYCTCTGWLIENRFRVEAVIREAMQKAQPQWISVEEKLPKVDEKVLAYAPKYAETAEESSAEQEFPTVDWAIRAAEKIFSLYRDSNYFRSMPPKPLIAGWAKIILDNAPTQPFILSEAYARAAAPRARPKIICLCGSTRFYEHFQRANYDETMLGNIVLSVGFYPHARKEMHHEEAGCTPEQKIALDELHKRKIDLADEVLVLNVGGYIGSSTRSEIDYAEAHGKPVRYLVAELGVGESPAAAPQCAESRQADIANFESVSVELFGCCSYEDTWKPGIKGWGGNDAESRASGYVSVGNYDDLLEAYKQLAKKLDESCAAAPAAPLSPESNNFLRPRCPKIL